MDLLPAIDVRRGRVVRLEQGDDRRSTEYDRDPARLLAAYGAAGARWVHLVDLDAAFGEPRQTGLVRRLAELPGRPRLEVGGGLRSPEAVASVLEAGVERVVVGSLVARDPDGFAAVCRSWPGRVVPALDVGSGTVRVDGWREEGLPWKDVAPGLRDLPCPAVLVTDVDRDGTFRGPNVEVAVEIAREARIPALVSGGVACLDDLRRARARREVTGIVVGKALLEGEIGIAEALGAVAIPTGLTARIIPCLDVANGRVVKGVRFENLREMGEPAATAAEYAAQGADEIVFLDVSASHEGRATRLDWVEAVAREVFVPWTVGGGVGSVEDARELLLSGADKVAVNTAAVERPELLSDLADRFGRQCVVLSVDARRVGEGWEVVTHGGRRPALPDALAWIEEGVRRGAGEVLLTSMDGDGTRSGYDLTLLRLASWRVGVPVIASGGAGEVDHLAEALEAGAAAVLAASIFHDGDTTVGEVKAGLAARGFPMREVA